MAMAVRLEDQLKQVPAKPGVYLFRDAKGAVLYVGKAKTLRPRVRSYFQRGQDGRALRRGDVLSIGRAVEHDGPLAGVPDLNAPIRVVPGPDRERGRTGN